MKNFGFLLALSVLVLGCASGPADSGNAAEFRDLGIAYFENGDFSRARDYLERAYQSDASLAGIRYNLARAYMQTSEADRAIPLLILQLEEQPENQLLKETLAAAYLLSDQPSPAADLLLPLQSSLGKGGFYNLILALVRSERFGELQETLEFLPAVWYEEDKKLSGMAGVAYRLLDQRELALELLEVAKDEESYFAWNLAELYAEDADFLGAAELYEKLFAEEYRTADAASRLVQIYYLQLDDADSGFEWLKTAREADPDFSFQEFAEFLTPSQLSELSSDTGSADEAE